LIGGDLNAARAQIDRALSDATKTDLTRRARSLMTAVEAAAGERPWPLTQPAQAPSNTTPRWESSSAVDLAARGSLRSDDPWTARPLLSRLARAAAGGAQWLGWLAEAECWRELWSEASALAERGLRLAGETGESVATVRLRYVLALIAANRGRLEQARSSAREGLEAARRSGLAPLTALNLAVIGYIELSGGSGQAALAAFEPILGAQLPGPEPGLLRLIPNGIEAQIGAGLLDQAQNQLARLDACQATLPVRWLEASCARCHGALAAATGALEEAERWLERAIATEGSPPRQLELGRHLLALGAVRRRQRRREGAAAALQQARSLFTELGADSWRAQAEHEIERLGRGRPGVAPDSLTATQLRIADLVARGNTNKEIAQALSLSVYTVESHLKVMFRKLAVQSRAALAFRLAEGQGRQPEDHEP
jgi:DNA-binding CsgD family transcriptional regulator